jgi:membrane-bound lytic murein transglycosylase B
MSARPAGPFASTRPDGKRPDKKDPGNHIERETDCVAERHGTESSAADCTVARFARGGFLSSLLSLRRRVRARSSHPNGCTVELAFGEKAMRTRSVRLAVLITGLCLVTLCTGPAAAATCGSGSFEGWLDSFRKEAAAQGIAERTLAAALNGVSYDPSVVTRDHSQGVFKQSFEQFSGRMISPSRLRQGSNRLKQYAGTFSRIDQQFGVPSAVIVAIWGLETDYGANNGRFPTLRSLATLAYDCRRSEMFQTELMDALRIVQRGDLNPAEMRGAWAGEIGQTQLMPSSYLKFAVDFDGNGRRDLIHSAPDALASTANYLKGYGWHRGQPWTPGSANYDVLLQWNKSQVYSRTVAAFATRLDSEP